MNFFCYICGLQFQQTSFAIYHLKNEHLFKEYSFVKLHCIKSKDCNKQFQTFSGLRRHALECKVARPHCSQELDSNEPTQSSNSSIQHFDSRIIENLNSSPPQNSITNEIEVDVESFANTIIDLSLAEVKTNIIFNSLKDLLSSVMCGTNSYLSSSLNVDADKLSEYTKIFANNMVEKVNKYSSSYKRKRILTGNSFYVEPIPKYLGLRWDKQFDSKTNHYNKILKQCTFQYISILSSIKAIFQNESFKRLYFERKHICNPNTLKGFCCSENYCRENIFNDKNNIQIQLFYDDFEVVNPLGSKTSIHKIGAIYFTIKNLPYEFNSLLSNIHLVSLFYVADLKNDNISFNNILDPIVKEIKELENDGMYIGGINIKGTLVNVCHDNLGGNSLFGFVESFRANFFCRICTMSKIETETNKLQSDKFLRTQTDYDNMFQSDKSKIFTDYNMSKGIKNYCILNELKYFHVIRSGNVDLMHDVLEGIVPFAIRWYLKYMIDLKYISADFVNNRIKSFNFGYLQRKNYPSFISLEKSNTSIGLTAAQNLCLMQHFPLIFHDLIEKGPNLWDLIVSLLKVLNIILSKEIPFTEISNLKSCIENHLTVILEVYKKRLIPKHHMITHYPLLITRMGPPIHNWAMRYEGKHKELLRDFQTGNNYKNICHSLASRCQQNSALLWQQIDYEKTQNFGKLRPKNTNSYLQDFFQSDTLELFSTNWIKEMYGYTYRIGFIIKLQPQSEYGLIEDILLFEEKIFIYFRLYKYERFLFELNSYQLQCTDSYKIVCFCDLTYKKPYELFTVNEKLYIIKQEIDD